MAGRAGSRFRATEGLNRLGTAVKAATSFQGHRPRTGDITAGELVEVNLSAAIVGTARVRSRSTEAMPTSIDLDNFADYTWSIEDSLLTVNVSPARTGTFRFWVW